MSDVTRMLQAVQQGNAGATEQLLSLVYEELRVVAAENRGRPKKLKKVGGLAAQTAPE